jgi:hypothetical protein
MRVESIVHAAVGHMRVAGASECASEGLQDGLLGSERSQCVELRSSSRRRCRMMSLNNVIDAIGFLPAFMRNRDAISLPLLLLLANGPSNPNQGPLCRPATLHERQPTRQHVHASCM